jgi:hypothetical protein
MLLTAEELKKVASSSGVAGKALERLLRSTSTFLYDRGGKLALTPDPEGGATPSLRKLELGLCLEKVGTAKAIDRAQLIIIVSQALRQYASTCPAVTAWLGRGDFDPRKFPAGLSVAFILHANRTAGRLRAGILRAI